MTNVIDTPTPPAPTRPRRRLGSPPAWLAVAIGIVSAIAAAPIVAGWYTDAADARAAAVPVKEAAVAAMEDDFGVQLVRLGNSAGTDAVLDFPTEPGDNVAYYQTRLPSGDVRLCQYGLIDADLTVLCDLAGEAQYSDLGDEWNNGKWTTLEPLSN